MIHRSSLSPQIENFTPVGQKVLLRRHARPDTKGGIVLPGIAAHTDMAHFDILKVGPKCEHVRVGDVALAPCQIQFGKIELAGEKLEIASEEMLAAVIPA